MLTTEQLEKAKSLQLSNSFTLYELIKSDSYPNFVEWPSDGIIGKLTEFATKVLQPIRDEFGPIRVNSGYRNKILNRMVGGVENSIHQIMTSEVFIGCAADIVPADKNIDIMDVYWWIADKVPAAKNIIIYRTKYVTKTPFIHVDTRYSSTPRTMTLEKIKSATYVPLTRG